MPTQDKYAHWRALLAADKITKLLQELREELAKSDRLDEIIQQSARYSALRKNIRLGVISYDDGKMTEAQIQSALAEFLTEMEELERSDKVIARQLAHLPAENLASADPHFLTPKPQKPEIFVGREDQLEELHEMLFTPGADHFLLLVNGEGGIGKTTLASAYFYRYHQEYAHAAWVLGETSIAGALLTLAVGLNLEFGPTETTDQRLHRLMTRLANLNEPCLLVVDNANDLEDLDANYEILRRCDNFHLLLTSRLREYQRARLVPVDPLETDTAEDLFATHYRPLDAAESELFKTIYTAVGGNTLVLEILAKNLKRVNILRERYTLADLLRDLQQKGLLRLVETRAVDTSYGKLRRAKPEEIIGAMYELEDLTEPQLKLLSVFAVLPPDKIPVAHLEVLLDDFAEMEEPLLDLAQRGWVEFDELVGSFRCSPVVQAVVQQKNEDWKAVLPVLRNNIAGFLKTDQGNIKVGIKAAQPFVLYGEAIKPFLPLVYANNYFLQQLAHFYNSSGDLRSSYTLSEERRILLQDLLTKDPENPGIKNSLAASYSRLGETHSLLGNLPKALEFFELDIKLSKELHAAYPENVGFKNGLAISYSKLGETHSSLGNLPKALEFFELDIELLKELHAAYPDNVGFKNGLAISYSKLGETHSSMGNLPKALEFFETEMELFEELHAAYPDNVGFKNGLAISYQFLGNTQKSLGNLDGALLSYDKYNQLGKELHTAYPDNVGFKNVLAISYEKLGETHSSMGNLPKALEFFETETELSEELHAAYPDNVGFKNGLAISYAKLGETHSSMGNLPKALEFFETQTELFEELHTAYPDNVGFKNGLAISYVKLGEVAQDPAQKRQQYQKAEQMLVELTEAFPDYAQFQRGLRIIRERLTDL